MDITAAAIATIISTVTSCSVTLIIAKFNSKKNLDDQLDAIMKICIQYPYLESIEFANNWNGNYDKDDEKFLRYEMYGTLIFNYMSRLSKFHNYEEEEIEKHVAIKSWARTHKNYWLFPTVKDENVNTYDANFVKLINEYIKY